MVYYLKYRPQTLDEIIGQDNIRDLLKKSLEQGKLSHAYLFTGPRGVGKTSTARILAKMVNCEKGGCNKCEICKSITDGSNLDLIEIDGASNRGIDDIRELRDKVKLAPTSLKKKVYIIDEVHMLTTEAFNALLKTLEEPPDHALFILATTEVNKIPATILSRVTRLDFKAATKADIVSALKRVVDGEKIKVDDDALDLLAQRGEGSFRDGIKLLDQLSSSGEKITLKMVEEGLRSGEFEGLSKLVEAFSEKDTKGALLLLGKELENGTNLKEYLLSLMEMLRELLLIKYQVEADLTPEKIVALKALSDKFSIEKLIVYLDNFQKAYEGMKVTPIAQLPFEIALIESCQVGDFVSSRAVEEKPVVEEVIKLSVRDDIEVKSSRVIDRDIEAPSVSQKKELNVKHVEYAETDDVKVLRDKWNYILEMIRQDNFSLEALLKQVEIAGVDNGVMMLKVPYTFHQRILETPRNRDLLESVVTDVLGKPIRLGCILEPRPVRVEELANVEVAADDDVIKVAAEIFNS